MQVKCPACNAGFSLDAALAIDAGRSAVMQALAMPASLARPLASYLAMFRATGRALNFDRAEKLMAELQPMLENATVTRNGSTRVATLAVRQQAFERMVEHRDAGKLDLPLKSHGYLLEIVYAIADKIDAKAERETEHSRQRGQHRAPQASPATGGQSGNPNLERVLLISRVRGDLDLGLIDREVAEQQLRDAHINPEVLDG